MDEETEIATQQNFTTGVQKETIDFQWDIPEFQEILDNPIRLHLQQIYLKSQDKSKWHLSLNIYRPPCGGVHCTFNCKLESATTNSQVLAVWEIFAINADGESTTQFETEELYKVETFFNHMQHYGIATLKHIPMVNDTLSIRGKLTIYNGTKNFECSPKFLTGNFEKSSLLELQRDMSDLQLTSRKDDKFTDMEICTDDGTVIRAHRGILAARNEYFKALISTDMMKKPTGIISIKGINGKAMTSLLHFLYSGSLSEDWSNPEILHDFAKAAHRFQIMTLVEFLDANIVKVCDSQSAGDLLLLCKTLGMKTAEDGLRQLIKNNLKQIGGEPEFDDLLLLIAKRQNVLA